MTRRLVVEADGGSRGNPGPAGYGALVRDADSGELLAEVAEAIGTATNNVAEYRGLLAGLRAAVEVDPACTVRVRMDSKLVVEQMSGRWQIKHADMRTLAAQARGVLPPSRVSYEWIPRARNSHADRLANEALDAAAAGRPWVRKVAPGAAAAADTAPAGTAPATGTARASVRAPQPATGEPTTLLLVRHGRTRTTIEGRFAGRSGEDADLADEGRAEAAALAELLVGAGRPGSPLAGIPPVDAVVTSPLRRARRTAAAVLDRLPSRAGAEVDVRVDDAWAEADFGAWEGLTYAQVARRDAELLTRWQGATDVAPPGGETLDEVVARVEAARAAVVTEHPGRTVLVVTHTTPVRVAVREAMEAGPAALWRLRVTPCAVTAVRYWDDGGVEVVTANATAHLAAL